MLNQVPRLYLAGTIIAIVVVFYGYSNLRRQGNLQGNLSLRERMTVAPSKFDVPSSRFAGIETLRKAQSEELIAEVEKLIEQEGLYGDVFVDQFSEQDNEKNNIAVLLNDLFHEYDTQSINDLQKLWEASPIGSWDVDKQKIDSVKPILSKLESKRQMIRAKLRQTTTYFYYIFIRPQSLKSVYYVSTIVNTEASKYIADYALLEEYAIAQALLDGNIEAATEALAYIFRIAQLASELAAVGVRSDAAQVRIRAFDVMQRVVLDPKFDKAQMIVLQEMLSEQFQHRKSEYITWFGDRASGLSLFHQLQMTQPENALEPDELQFLKDRGVLDAFPRSFIKYHEADEVFYLRAMQQILGVCEKPFVERLSILNQINKELIATESTYDEQGIAMEHFAANILLKDIDRLMRFFAQDESVLNRTLAVMSLSLGQSDVSNLRDPFTNQPYEVRKVNGMLNVSGNVLQRPFRVPIFVNIPYPL